MSGSRPDLRLPFNLKDKQDLEGHIYYQEKKGLSKIWKKRWIVVFEDDLFVFKSRPKKGKAELMVQFTLNGTTLSDVDLPDRPYSFTISLVKHHWRFQCESKLQKKEWLIALAKRVGETTDNITNLEFDDADVLTGLRQVYLDHLYDLEEQYLYKDFHSLPLQGSDFNSNPIVLLIGPYSVGKTSFIEYLIQQPFPNMRIGPEPTTDRFVAVMHDEDERIIPGVSLALDTNKPFGALNSFGQGFLNRFEGALCRAELLKSVTFIDSPGILSGKKQTENRSYNFIEIIEWFAEKADLILLLFDAFKLDISDEFRGAIEAVAPYHDKIKVVLNKAQMIEPPKLMKVYGALLWSLGKVITTPEVTRVFTGSFKRLEDTEESNYELSNWLFRQERDELIRYIFNLKRNGSMRKVNDLVLRMKNLKAHILILDFLRNNMPNQLTGKGKARRELLENLPTHYKTIARDNNMAESDFPDHRIYAEQLGDLDLKKLPKIRKDTIGIIDDLLGRNLPKLISMVSNEVVFGNEVVPLDYDEGEEIPDLTKFKTFQKPSKTNEEKIQVISITEMSEETVSVSDKSDVNTGTKSETKSEPKVETKSEPKLETPKRERKKNDSRSRKKKAIIEYPRPKGVSGEDCASFSMLDWLGTRIGGDLPDIFTPETKPVDLLGSMDTGIVLCNLINDAVPGTIDERAINNGKLNRGKKRENQTLVLNSAAAIGCDISKVDLRAFNNQDKMEEFTWNIITIGVLSQLDVRYNSGILRLLKEGETYDDIYSIPKEQLLMRWVNYHVEKGNEDPIENFDADLSDSIAYLVLMNQIAPGKVDLDGLEEDINERAEIVIENAEKLGCRKFLQEPVDVIEGESRLHIAFLANLFNQFSALDPVEDFDIYLENEEVSFINWINSIGVTPVVNDLSVDLSDGLVLLQIFDIIKAKSVDWSRATNKPFPKRGADLKMIENCNLVIEIAEKFDFSLVNIEGKDIYDKNKKLTLSLLAQMRRAHSLSILMELIGSSQEVTEEQILQWGNDQVEEDYSFSSFSDDILSSGIALSQVIDSIKPGTLDLDCLLESNERVDKIENARYVISSARKMGAKVFAFPEDIVDLNSDNILLFFSALMAASHS